MIIVTTRSDTSADHYSATDMFARNITKNNDFIRTFGNTPTNNHTIEPQQTEKYGTPRPSNLNPINTDESSFFDFEPSSRAESPYQNHFSTPGTSDMAWSNEGIFRPFTPPSSASFSPKNWAFNSYQSGTPSTIFTNLHQAGSRAPYGQPTPPDDEHDNESLLDHQLHEQREHREQQEQREQREQLEQREMQPPQEPDKGKRKRNQDSTNQSSPKRPRKYAARRSNNNNDLTKPEDVKRSKFLERNRVAASKCRQKKKEWTQNLENRARELQKDNNQIRMVVDSCREEVLFLKAELLKHSQCDCESIQTFIKSGANNFADHKHDEDLFKRETSPIESMPSSRLGSIDAQTGQSDVDSTSPPHEPSNTSIAEDDSALEALLTSSMNLDMMNEGVTSLIPVAAAA